MRVIPFLHCPFLSIEDIRNCECSDRIILSKSMYEKQRLQGGPIIIHLSNVHNNSVTGTLYNVHDYEHDDIYVPSWMFERLNVCDRLSLALVAREFCTKIVIRPHQVSLLHIPDWNTKLATSLKYYSTLTRKTRIPIILDGCVMYITIEDLNDNKKDTYFMENGREIDVEVLKPLDMPESSSIQEIIKEPTDIPYLHKRPPKRDPYPRAFTGSGYRSGGSMDTSKSNRELFLEHYERSTAAKSDE